MAEPKIRTSEHLMPLTQLRHFANGLRLDLSVEVWWDKIAWGYFTVGIYDDGNWPPEEDRDRYEFCGTIANIREALGDWMLEVESA